MKYRVSSFVFDGFELKSRGTETFKSCVLNWKFCNMLIILGAAHPDSESPSKSVSKYVSCPPENALDTDLLGEFNFMYT